MLTVKKIIKNNLWVASLLTLIMVLIIIPLALTLYTPSFTKAPKGDYVKKGNRVFYNFLKQLKQTNSILVLGTSETGNQLNGNNYHSLLNRDEGFNKSVYSFGGAGRCSNVYFPLILDKSEAFSGLEIIYYINPTYWRQGLNQFSEGYFNRYVSEALAQSVKNKAVKEGVYKKFMCPKDSSYSTSVERAVIERSIIDFKSFYYYDLNKRFEETKSYSVDKISLNEDYSPKDIEGMKEKVNPEFNVSENFLKTQTSFPQIDTTSIYQYDLLLNFIRLIKKHNIKCTFYLGPYNEIYCMKKNPEFILEHREVLRKIKNILSGNDVEFIDGSSLSTVPGTFIDVQHISEYGAYLTALQIKEYYEKNN